MKFRYWLTWGGLTLGLVSAGITINSFRPQRFRADYSEDEPGVVLDRSRFPTVDVTFLRCGSITIPECIAVRGSLSLAPRVITHSAVLIRHPQGTFLYDSGLCTDISLFLMDQSLFFRKTLANFTLEKPIGEHLQDLHMTPSDLDFVLLSHMHWDHVSGLPDLQGVPVRINRVEYVSAFPRLMEQNQGLVRRLLEKSPVELFDCVGTPYEGFRSSLDLFGDGSIILVPLPGHTPGQTGMFINRSNGSRLFLIGDAAWVSDNYRWPATMHPFIWSRVTRDDATARQTLSDLHHFATRHPEVTLLAMHDGRMQEEYTRVEGSFSAGPIAR